MLREEHFPAVCLPREGAGEQRQEQEEVVLGIDEAGRGPVLGPMTYCAAFWPLRMEEEIAAMGFDDSKALSEETRERMLTQIQREGADRIGYVCYELSAEFIGERMLRKEGAVVSLNEMSHNCAIDMITYVRSKGVRVSEVYVDTVGDPGWYQQKLMRVFNDEIQITVAKKADAIYKCVGAASIVAKVTRDRILANWTWQEPGLQASREFGSGYPSDPKCGEWLQANVDPVFGLPSIARFSWGTTKDLLDENGITMRWQADEDDEATAQTAPITSFFSAAAGSAGGGRTNGRSGRQAFRPKRQPFFASRGMEIETEL